MSFSFGFVSNDPNLTGCALAAFEGALNRPGGAPDGWGMGYYQAGQPLLRKQPKAHDGPLDIAALASGLRATTIIGHCRDATAGGKRTDNTHPFRYRNWLCCHSGRVDRFEAIRDDLLRSVPDFIRRNIRGKTDSEHLFHLYLSFLNDTGKLDDPRISGEVAAQALGSTYAYVERLVADRGGSTTEECCIVTNGHILLAIRRGMPVHISRQSDFNCPDGSGRVVPAPNLKAVLLVAGEAPSGPGYEQVADRAIVTIDHNLNIDSTREA